MTEGTNRGWVQGKVDRPERGAGEKEKKGERSERGAASHRGND